MNFRFGLLALIGGCSTSMDVGEDTPYGYEVPAVKVDKILQLKEKYRASSIGVGVIRAGELVWTGYYGEQSPGVQASAATMYNVASVNKAVTTEAVLRLVQKGVLGLDEPIHRFYVHPDLAADVRYDKLTPRVILTHKTGLLNWSYEYTDGKLAFLHEPGETYGYSGAGFMILAHFLQNKLDRPFPQIVREQVFDPIGMSGASVVQERWMNARVARPLLANGRFDADFQLDYGYWNAADDLFVTVEDYAQFLISVMNGEGVGSALAAERARVQTDLTSDDIWRCDDGPEGLCPSSYGHGLGWFVFGYDGNLNIQHGGNDSSEAAIGYFETGTHDGMVVFVNAPSPEGVFLWPQIVDILDEDAKFTDIFHHIIAKFFAASDK